ncbi:L-fucose:H+ symporter permease [Pseudoduganella umbonata]|uniref:FHS family L-fucose permease-like MFS transporter n=2 Tax=Pseudoduganella umbonata TaxID=864828 RepID=A0A7W5EGZ0_9BURK|nr:L-fucose:H+ symporter permease [Pseudoduganella umbonata]MBB3225137.1 FHS family L-fucose permease-like MFS transporter [Pseudoduganella umbonata]
MTVPTARRSYKFAFLMLTTLFFMWGFVHNLDPILIPHLRRSFSLTVLQAALVDSAVYVAYFVMALPAGLLIRRAGYRCTIIAGLLLFGIGSLLFLPAADTHRYAVFLAALFIIACGLTLLETAANPYAALLGRPERATQRLNLAQSFNGLAAAIAPIVGARLILVEGATDAQLRTMAAGARQAALAAEAASVKGPYLVLGLVIFAIAVVFYFIRLPEPERKAAEPGERVAGAIGRAWRHGPVRRAVVAQFFYVGAQVCVFSFFILFAAQAAGLSQIAAADYLGWGCGVAFVAGRFAGTCAMKYVAPARLLLAYALVCSLLSVFTMFASGMACVAAVIGIVFFMSIMFPTIFALGIQDAGANTEMGSSLIIMAIVGGALLPLAFGFISDITHSIQLGYGVPLVCFLVVAWFARTVLVLERTAAPVPPLTNGALKRV